MKGEEDLNFAAASTFFQVKPRRDLDSIPTQIELVSLLFINQAAADLIFQLKCRPPLP